MTVKQLHASLSRLPKTAPMPTLFVGHGSPMNAIEQNRFTAEFSKLTDRIPKPQAIVCISAHWETIGTQVTANEAPATIHDFYGFPPELYEVQYPAPGLPKLAQDLSDNPLITSTEDWGIDHGTWSVLRHMYPDASIPVLQVSLDRRKTPLEHLEMAQQLNHLRSHGVLIVGSGNLIHNLGLVKWSHISSDYSYDWAQEAHAFIDDKLKHQDAHGLAHYQSQGSALELAAPTPEHFLPILYAMGANTEIQSTELFNDKIIAGSLSMTSAIFK